MPGYRAFSRLKNYRTIVNSKVLCKSKLQQKTFKKDISKLLK